MVGKPVHSFSRPIKKGAIQILEMSIGENFSPSFN
jgi:hypothetical protein